MGEEKKSLLAKWVASLSSKLIGGEKDVLVGKSLKVFGGNMRNSFLVSGIASKEFSTSAEHQKIIFNPKILLLNIEMDVKLEKEMAEIRLSDPSQYQSLVEAEWNIYEKLDKSVRSGAKVILSRLAIDDLATQYFTKRDVFCAGHVTAKNLNQVAAATGATILTSGNDVIDEVLGSCEMFHERQVGRTNAIFSVDVH